MKHKEIKRTGKIPEIIHSKISVTELDCRRKKEETENGKLKGAEHCFRIADNWYKLNVGYTNPINREKIHSELLLIEKQMEKNNDQIYHTSLKDKEIIFYGVGVGDTEIACIDWILRKNSKIINITGIDVNKEFLENFALALRNRLIETEQGVNIYYRAYHSLFEQINKEDLVSYIKNKTHICLGNTIGNFSDQNDLFQMFSKLCEKEDSLILGIQLNQKLDVLYRKYSNNHLFDEFILNYIPKQERGTIIWELDKNKGVISATHKGIEVFRTKKYDPGELSDILSKYDFVLNHQVIDNYQNACIQSYLKK